MKKMFTLALSLALTFSLASCGTNEGTKGNSSSAISSQSQDGQQSGQNTEGSSETVTEWVPFEPITYTGSGDDVIEIAPPEDRPWMLSVTGNSGSHHFAVKGYDSSQNYTELFVNTTEPYTGDVLDPSQSTVVLEITAQGDWSITLSDLYATAPSISEGETISGSGDAIYQINSYGLTANVSGNSDAHHFAVKTFGSTSYELLVNTTDPYDGKVMLKGEPYLMVITSASDWTIEF